MESPSGNILSTYKFWLGSSLTASVLLVKLAPHYSISASYPWTAAVLFLSQWIVYGLYAVVIYPRFISPLRHLPQPKGNSFFNGQWAAITREPSGIPMRRWANEIPNEGLIRYLHLFNRERLLLTSPKALAEVLTTNSYDFVKPRLFREGLGQVLGIGLLFAEGDEHKVQRKALMPAFNFRHIKELYPIFWAKSQEMVASIEATLKETAPDSEVEIGEWISRATLDIIGLAGMGQDFNSLKDPDTKLNRVYRNIFQPSRAAQVLGILQFFIPISILRLLPLKRNDDIMAASQLARETSRQLVQAKKEKLQKKEMSSPDIISVALESGGFTDEQLVDNMMTFMAAGHETTASSFIWAVYLMCQKPQVQTKLREAIHANISRLSDSMDHGKLDGIAYLHAVCNEVLRIYAPVPMTLRDTAHDTTILGQFVPKTVKIIIAPWAINHNKQLWGEDAEEFNPDRWMVPGQTNSGGAVSNYAFLTFLHGPRSCIGQRFAVAELACLLAAFVGKYEFEMVNPDEKIEIKGGITARPKNGMHIKLKVVEGCPCVSCTAYRDMHTTIALLSSSKWYESALTLETAQPQAPCICSVTSEPTPLWQTLVKVCSFPASVAALDAGEPRPEMAQWPSSPDRFTNMKDASAAPSWYVAGLDATPFATFRVFLLGTVFSTMSSPSRNDSPQPLAAPVPTKIPSPEPGLTMSITHRLNTGGSVQALTILADDCLIAGLQGGRILAWSLSTYQLLFSFQAHQEGVVSLYISDDGELLFSGGADSLVNVWSTHDFQRLYSVHSTEDVGDIFSIIYSSDLQTLFCGAQDQSIQWYDIGLKERSRSPTSASFDPNRKHRFFDSLGPGETVLPGLGVEANRPISRSGQCLNFSKANYVPFAHRSYVYTMLLIKNIFHHAPEEELLISGGGDGSIKLWSIDNLEKEGLMLLEKFKNEGLGVLSMAYSDTFLYVGFTNGKAHVYSLDSRQLVQKLDVRCGDIGAIQVIGGKAFCGGSGGYIKQFNSAFAERVSWCAHSGKILGSTVFLTRDRDMFITGGNDNTVAFWDVTDRSTVSSRALPFGNDDLLLSLRRFVAYKTISSNPAYAGECSQAATFLRKQFSIFHADTAFLATEEGINPILLAGFSASKDPQDKKTVLFYGHYDVVDAQYDRAEWHAEPFQLHPLNGYLYGRGVTDNKAPILAALYAVADLARHGTLNCNIVFLIEGEEEAGSRGFVDAVRRNRKRIGNVDFILLANSYWLDDHIPCLTYGMRGVIHVSMTVASGKPDRHSGMDGKSSAHEPLKDLMLLLSMLSGASGTSVLIPNFYHGITELTEEELMQYSEITSTLMPGHAEIKDPDAFTDSLIQRWREPNLTIHRVDVPESKTAVTIPRFATATLSIRIVPGQDAEEIAADLISFAKKEFRGLSSTNNLEIRISSMADAWLGDPSNEIFQALESAITQVWSPEAASLETLPRRSISNQVKYQKLTPPPSPIQASRPSHPHRRASTLASQGSFNAENMPRKPLYIREGGSIPAISFLEREFGAPAAMFPMGQASDNAHLGNERMRVENLYKGREVFKKVFATL